MAIVNELKLWLLLLQRLCVNFRAMAFVTNFNESKPNSFPRRYCFMFPFGSRTWEIKTPLM